MFFANGDIAVSIPLPILEWLGVIVAGFLSILGVKKFGANMISKATAANVEFNHVMAWVLGGLGVVGLVLCMALFSCYAFQLHHVESAAVPWSIAGVVFSGLVIGGAAVFRYPPDHK